MTPSTATASPSDRPNRRKFQVLIDSDAFVGQVYPDDAHFERANRIFQALAKQQARIVTTSLVVAETATVLSYRGGQNLARTFLEVIGRGNIPVVHINEDLQADALNLFSQQTKKGTSVTDCANVTVIRRFQIPSIFSFDKVYERSFKLKLTQA